MIADLSNKTSYDTAIPHRDKSSDCTVHRTWCSSRTKPLTQESHSLRKSFSTQIFTPTNVIKLHALQHTTHPSAFAIPTSIVTRSLRDHSHPNFIRWSTVNGNQPRMIFGRVLGATNILFGFVIAILLTLSYKSRWWRVFAALAWFLGFSFLLAGSNGICLVLYVTHDRHLRPWEQYTADVESKYSTDDSDQTTLAGSDVLSMSHNGTKKRHVALEAFGTANSYGSEVWVEKYRAKMMIRKIFDRTVWVQNESLKLMQDKVALQALIWSAIVTVPLTVLFTALPKGHFY